MNPHYQSQHILWQLIVNSHIVIKFATHVARVINHSKGLSYVYV